MRSYLIPLVLLGGPLLPGTAQETKDKVYRDLSPAGLEEFFKSEKIPVQKSAEPKNKDTFYYDYQRSQLSIRITSFAGKDLMIDTVFPKVPLAKVNEWNLQAKFSRACLHENDKAEFVSLEQNLDLTGGVTEEGLRKFLTNFYEEADRFQRFVSTFSRDDVVFKGVPVEKLEAVFRSLNITVKKSPGPGENVTHFDYELDKLRFTLINIAGKELVAVARFPKIDMDVINQYNLNRKFVRVSLHKVQDQEFTSLESFLDCQGGTSEAILRGFIVGFEDEVRHFIETMKKTRTASR